MSFSTIIIVLAILLIGVGAFIFRSSRLSRSEPLSFNILRDISSQGHYAMFIQGSAVGSELTAHEGTIKLALFRLVPSSTEFDAGAVSVFFGPHLVGQMSRKDAAAYRIEYGEEETKCRGIYNIKDGLHNVWLDINLGSGVLGASSVMQTQELRDVFQIPSIIPAESLEVVNGFLSNNMVRIFDARLTPKDDEVEVIIDGLVMSHLSSDRAKLFTERHGSSSIGTLALVRRTVDGPQIILLANNKLSDLVNDFNAVA